MSEHERGGDLSPKNQVAQRYVFLQACQPATVEIQQPLIDPAATRGHPNPAGLGQAARFSLQGSWGQSSVLFSSLEDYSEANASGVSPYGGAEYGVPLTPEADLVCQKLAALHGGCGAVICPSGLSAITTTIEAFSPRAILLPENVYPPLIRYLKRKNIQYFQYPAGAAAEEVDLVLQQVIASAYRVADLMFYLEAPGSGTFEIPDISGIAALARQHGIRSVMDNTWASHVRCKPIQLGVDLVIQATTKYEGGYGDTPSGVVIARAQGDFSRLEQELRASGNGAVAPTTCSRLLLRLDSAATRLDRHHETALRLAQWFQSQAFVEQVLSPALPDSPWYERFKTYFGKGNGLFSVVFNSSVTSAQISAFTRALHLFWVGESWGGHVSLVLPVAGLEHSLRFHAGLEDAGDLLRDLELAAACFEVNAPGSAKLPG